ncbi:Nup85 nucleoporin-domain-containing protein [Sparassis latifolia]
MQSKPHAGPANLLPPLISKGGVDDFRRSGRTLAAGISPRDDTIAIYATPNADPQTLQAQNASYPEEQNIYLASAQHAPSSERRVFVTDTSVIFAALQRLLTNVRKKDIQVMDHEPTLEALNKLAYDYINFCKECCAYASQSITRTEPLQFSAEHYAKLFSCFSLFTLLYLPDAGHDRAPVGDELMEWLNTHFIQPSTEEGDHLSTLEKPWEDDTFWPYLTRTTLRGMSKASAFFLKELSRHPSMFLQRIAAGLLPLVTNHPRLYQYNAERDFVIAYRRWRDRVKALRLELNRIPDAAREDEAGNWWERMSAIVGLLEGRPDVTKRICVDLGADWKEVCVAWSVFVDTRLRRQDMPDVVAHVLNEMPADPTNMEDVIHTSLLLGKPKSVLVEAAQMDIWLAAHFADMMEPLELIESEPDDSDLSLRQQYVLSYTEYLRSDPALWRITVDYMCTCGDIGKQMADEVLVRVPLRLQAPRDSSDASAERERIRTGNLAGVLKDVAATCFEHQREGVRRTVCRIAAQTFLREQEYGMAVSFCTSAEDWPGLGRIVDRVLDDYITQGPEKFARHVAGIAPSLQVLRAEVGANSVFVYRLLFAVRLAEFHQRRINGDLEEAAADLVAMLREDIAPKSWWAVLLSNAVELLLYGERMLFTTDEACLLLCRLEEIHIRAAQGASEDYLAVLARTTKSGGEKHALQRLQTVRLALARYYARCGVIGVGGKNGIHSS